MVFTKHTVFNTVYLHLPPFFSFQFYRLSGPISCWKKSALSFLNFLFSFEFQAENFSLDSIQWIPTILSMFTKLPSVEVYLPVSESVQLINYPITKYWRPKEREAHCVAKFVAYRAAESSIDASLFRIVTGQLMHPNNQGLFAYSPIQIDSLRNLV